MVLPAGQAQGQFGAAQYHRLGPGPDQLVGAGFQAFHRARIGRTYRLQPPFAVVDQLVQSSLMLRTHVQEFQPRLFEQAVIHAGFAGARGGEDAHPADAGRFRAQGAQGFPQHVQHPDRQAGAFAHRGKTAENGRRVEGVAGNAADRPPALGGQRRRNQAERLEHALGGVFRGSARQVFRPVGDRTRARKMVDIQMPLVAAARHGIFYYKGMQGDARHGPHPATDQDHRFHRRTPPMKKGPARAGP